jgi:4'-phosphopantetheinyl transferase EntD
VIDQLLPGVVAAVETREDLHVALFPEEEVVIRRAVPARQREFITGRACARHALEQIRLPASSIARGALSSPVWPAGIVGSITHCTGYCAAAVARAADVATLGIDAAVNTALRPGIFGRIAVGNEHDVVVELDRFSEACVDTLIFSAKETVSKAWFPLTGVWRGFKDSEISVDLAARAFRARLLEPAPVIDGAIVTDFRGCWTVEGNVLCTAVVILRRPVQ